MKANYGYAHLLYKIREGAERVPTGRPPTRRDEMIHSQFIVMRLSDHVLARYDRAPQSYRIFKLLLRSMCHAMIFDVPTTSQ